MTDRSRFVFVQKRSGQLAMLLVVVLTALHAQTPPVPEKKSAKEQFEALQDELRKSHRVSDWHANLVSASQQETLLNGMPDSLLEVARAEVQVGDLDGAFRELWEFVRMGQSTDLLGSSPDFSALRNRAEFQKLRMSMQANTAAISRASLAFQLADSGLLAEDVDYDPGTKRFFITSVREKKIISTDAAGSSKDFANSPDDWPIMAIKVDFPHGTLWATEAAIQGFRFAPKADWGKSAVLCYDLRSGKLLRRIDGPRSSALGDMALTDTGDAIVSDGDGGGVYRVRANESAMERLDRGDFISPQTPAMAPDGKYIFVPDYVRGIGVLEIATGQVRWLSTEGRFALNGIDGLYLDHGRLLAVQNGTSPERVIAFRLNANFTKIVSETILERSTTTLGDPTHGVVVGDDFYYLANSGWSALDDYGEIKRDTKLSPARMMRVSPSGLD